MVLFNTTAESATPFDRAKNTLLTWMLAIGALDKVVDRMNVSLIFSPETRRSKAELGAELSRNFRSWNRRAVINTVRAVLVDRDSTLDALRNVKAPALVVSGQEDTILPSPHSRRIAEQLPKARHVEVPGAAHLVPLEASVCKGFAAALICPANAFLDHELRSFKGNGFLRKRAAALRPEHSVFTLKGTECVPCRATRYR
jgi:pimeloyl-ACP methyl ester carboxylesterase